MDKNREEIEVVPMQGVVSKIQREYGFWFIVNNYTEYFFLPTDCVWGSISFNQFNEGDTASFTLKPKKKAPKNVSPDKETSVKRRSATNIVARKNMAPDPQESIEEVKNTVTEIIKRE